MADTQIPLDINGVLERELLDIPARASTARGPLLPPGQELGRHVGGARIGRSSRTKLSSMTPATGDLGASGGDETLKRSLARLPTPIPVHCLDCAGSGGSDALAILGVIIAAVALVVALGALYIAAREHVVFIRQLKARADFELTGDVHNPKSSPKAPDLIEVGGTLAVMTLRVGITNVGMRAAGPTILRVLAPDTLLNLAWCDHRGVIEGAGGGRVAPIPTAERLTTPAGEDVAAWLIEKNIPRVALRTRHEAWLLVKVRVPFDLPVRIVAQSDDLPDDIEQRVLDKAFRIRRLNE